MEYCQRRIRRLQGVVRDYEKILKRIAGDWNYDLNRYDYDGLPEHLLECSEKMEREIVRLEDEIDDWEKASA